MRITRTVLAILPLVLGGALAAQADILGGGKPQRSDCYMTFKGINATSKGNIVDCTDNDPTCDADAVEGQCTFGFTVCVAQTDTGISGCAPGQVTKITGLRGPDVHLPTLPASTATCGAPSTFVLKLKKRKSTNKKLFNAAAFATGSPKKDPDKLILRCHKRISSTPAGAFVFE